MSRPDPVSARADRLAALLASRDLAALLACEPATIEWLFGSSDAMAAAVLVDRSGAVQVIDEPDDVDAALASLGLGATAPMGVELVLLAGALYKRLAPRPLTDVLEPLQRLRAVKTEDEQQRLRAASELASIGQRAFRAALRDGATEAEIYSQLLEADTRLSGSPAIVDLMFGERSSLIGAVPTGATYSRQAVALLDFAPQLDGFWGDSCSTVCSQPTAELRRLHAAALHGLERGIEAARPGLACAELDAIVRAPLRELGFEYPHFSGHGIGLRQQEPPFIVADSDMRLEEGMVIALEPGVYRSAYGLRVEHVFLVAADGAELLTDHDLSLT